MWRSVYSLSHSFTDRLYKDYIRIISLRLFVVLPCSSIKSCSVAKSLGDYGMLRELVPECFQCSGALIFLQSVLRVAYRDMIYRDITCLEELFL